MPLTDLNTIHNPAAGSVAPASWGDAIRDNFEYLRTAYESAWTAFTPTWSGTIGNGTIAAAYRQVGKTVEYRIKVTWGSTTTHAAATQTFSFPVARHAAYTTNHPVGTFVAHDLGVNVYGGTVCVTSAGLMFCSRDGGSAAANSIVTNTNPMAFGTGDELMLTGTYEAA